MLHLIKFKCFLNNKVFKGGMLQGILKIPLKIPLKVTSYLYLLNPTYSHFFLRIWRVARAATLITLAISIPLTTPAGIMGDLQSTFMSNQSSPGVMNGRTMTGVFGGSMVLSTPLKQVNIVAFDPPRLNAGCGGVDLMLGSFSMINGQQLIAVFRAVASNAAALAFKAAIHTISPGLDQLITEFQSLLQNMNNLAKNSCAMAHTLLQTTDKAIGVNLDGEGNQGAAQSGLFSDVFSGLQSYVADSNGFFKTAAKFNPNSGNQIVKAVVNSGASSILGVVGLSNADGSVDDATNPNDLNNRILVSLLGYSVAGVPCSSSNQLGTVDGSRIVGNDSGRIVCQGNATITLEDFVRGGGSGSSSPNTPMVLWYCLNPLGDSSGAAIDAQICTQMQKRNFNYTGVRGWVNTVLFGSSDATTVLPSSILGKLNANNGSNLLLTDAQRAFVSSAGQPVLGLLMKARRNDDRMNIALRLRLPIENCVVAELGRALVRASNAVTDANNFELTPAMLNNRDHLRQDTLGYIKSCSDDRTKEAVVQYMNDAATLMSRNNK